MSEVEVGRVYIKVSPDTGTFRRELVKDVNTAAKSAETEVQMGSEFNDDGLQSQAAAAARRARQEVEFKQKNDFEDSFIQMERSMAAIQRRRNADIGNNLAALRKDREAAEKAADDERAKDAAALQKKAADTRLQEEKRAKEEIVRLDREAEDLRKVSRALDSKALAGHNDLLKERGRLVKLAADEAKQDAAVRQRINNDIHKREVARQRQILAIRKKNQTAFDFPNFGTGLNPQAYMTIFAALLAYSAPILGFLTTALLALPGVIGLVAAPIGALALGMDGLKFAAKQLEKPLNDMKVALSAQAADTFTPIFARLPAAMAAVTPNLANVTKGVGDFTNGLVNAVAQEDGLLRVQGTLNNIGGFFSNTSTFSERFGAGLNTLANEFSDMLPDLGDWFNEQGTAFDEWVGKISSNGQLEQAFKNLGSVLDTIWEQITEILGLAFDGFSEENGADLLNASFETLGGTLKDIIEFSNALIENMEKVSRAAAGISGLFKIIAGDPFGAAEDLVFAARGGERPDYDGSDKDPVIEPKVSPEAVAKAEKDLSDLYTFGQDGAASTGEAMKESLSLSLGGRAAEGAPDFELPVIKGLSEREQKLEEHSQFVAEVTAGVRGSLEQGLTGETLPAPNFQAFESAWTGMGTVVDTATTQVSQAPAKMAVTANAITASFSGMGAATTTAFGEMVGAVRTGTNDAVTIMEGLPPRMTGPIESIGKAMYSHGLAIGNGLAKGIADSTEAAVTAAVTMSTRVKEASKADLGINSPSLEYRDQGNSIVEGLALGINGQAYLSQLAIKNAAAPNAKTSSLIKKAYEELGREGVIAGDTMKQLQGTPFTQEDHQRLSQLNKDTKELNSQLRFLKADLEASDAAGDVAIQAEIDRITEIKKRLNLEKKGLKLHKEAAGVKGEAQDEEIKATDYLNKAISAGQDFAMANANQFTSDLGIGGSGAISQAAGQGISFLSSSLSKLISGGFAGSGGNIVVNNVDDAVQAKQNQVNKQKKQFVTR